MTTGNFIWRDGTKTRITELISYRGIRRGFKRPIRAELYNNKIDDINSVSNKTKEWIYQTVAPSLEAKGNKTFDEAGRQNEGIYFNGKLL